ncbi:hypothetical protein U1Q18_020386 [Sarracenia purpurea var. burkii]
MDAVDRLVWKQEFILRYAFGTPSLQGYATPNSDKREGVLRRKRLEYLDCVAQYYDIPDTERTDEEVNMLRQIAVDCPRTVPDVSFFQQAEVQKSLERILYTCCGQLGITAIHGDAMLSFSKPVGIGQAEILPVL